MQIFRLLIEQFFQLLYKITDIIVVAGPFVPCSAELVAVVLGGIVLGQLLAHPPRDFCHGARAASFS